MHGDRAESFVDDSCRKCEPLEMRWCVIPLGRQLSLLLLRAAATAIGGYGRKRRVNNAASDFIKKFV